VPRRRPGAAARHRGHRLLHRETAEQEKLERIRPSVMIGIEDWRRGRVDDRPIDAILGELDGEEA
jgi:antitoxin ParD1/3/4